MLVGHARVESAAYPGHVGDALRSGEAQEKVFHAPRTWCRARRNLVLRLLRSFGASGPLLDVGCGPGEGWPGFETCGIDVSPEAVSLAREKGVNAQIADARDLPFADESFEAVLMLDVLEHIEDDYKALREAHRVLAKGRILIVSVPLHPFLWSSHDEAVGHVRRYKPGQVKRLLESEGFHIAYETRWNLFGLPGALLRKLGANIEGASELLGQILLAESHAAAQISLPYGLSEFCAGRKEE